MKDAHDDGASNDGVSREERIFGEALALPPAERAPHVLRIARGDRTLAGRVLDLLAAHATAGSFLESPAVRPPALASAAEVSEGPGTVIGPYELIEELGEGGFGIVYRARQLEPVRREVALKVIKLGMDTRQVIARFEAERQALAVLDHPHIARVLDAGATATGRPYFVMELVEGIDITQYCDAQKLDTRARMSLFIDVCDALQHAHQRGLIHRDLKPSNILVTRREGKHVPKVIDFGIAKATKQRMTERTVYTELGQFIGTPVYMSPEQAEQGETDVDTRSDIYSLGVVLYELLTGTPPFEAKELRDRGLAEIQTFIREHEPLPPSGRVTRFDASETTVALARCATKAELASQLRGDLDWIVMKALEKDRERRYESASAMAQDLERFLANLPVLAGPPSSVYRLRKFVRRHRIAVSAGAVVVVALLAGLGLMLVGFVQARRNLAIATLQADLLSDIFLASSSDRDTRLSVSDEALEESFKRAFGRNHAAYAGVLRLKAERLESEGRSADAISAYRAAMAENERVRGARSVEHVMLLAQFGRLLSRTTGYQEDAETLLVTALALEESVFDHRTPRLTGTRLVLAELQTNSGRVDGALDLYADALDVLRQEAPEDALLRFQVAQAYLTQGTIARRWERLAPIWLELLALAEDLYPDKPALRADARVQLATWNVEAEQFSVEDIVRHLHDALALYGEGPANSSLARARAEQALATTLFERNRPEDVDEALALLALSTEDVRAASLGSKALADTLDAYAARLEEHGRYALAIDAHLEVIGLRRELLGRDAEVRRHKEALERLAEALVYDQSLPYRSKDFLSGIKAVELLQRELFDGSEYAMYRRLNNALTLRSGNPTPALRVVGGFFGRLPTTEPKHPYNLAMAALAQNLRGRRERAEALLQEALELARRPEYSNDRQTQEMIVFVKRMLGEGDPSSEPQPGG